jgi:hypothetical protein
MAQVPNCLNSFGSSQGGKSGGAMAHDAAVEN